MLPFFVDGLVTFERARRREKRRKGGITLKEKSEREKEGEESKEGGKNREIMLGRQGGGRLSSNIKGGKEDTYATRFRNQGNI